MSRFEKPTRPGMRRAVFRTALAIASLAIVACDSSGPVEDTFILEGRIGFQGEQSHSLMSVDEGIARIEVVALRPRLIDVSGAANIIIGLGVGEPGGEGCAASFRANARVGSVFSIGFEEETEYCLLVFDPGTLPEDAVVDYTISVSPG